MFRKGQPLLHQLPDEVLQDRIITLLPSADQAAVRRTSKLLYNMSTRPFFRYLSLSEIPQIVKCCKVLTAKPEFADAVRELIVAGPRWVYIMQVGSSYVLNTYTIDDGSMVLYFPRFCDFLVALWSFCAASLVSI